MQGAEVNTVEMNTVECKEKYCVYVEEILCVEVNTECMGKYFWGEYFRVQRRLLQSAKVNTVEGREKYCRYF